MTVVRTLLAVALVAAAPLAASQSTARGVVFNDRNGNGVRDSGEGGIARVCVSNGLEVVRTDSQGRYELPLGNDTIVFVIKPAGYRTAVDENQLPRFYYIHKPAGSPPSRHLGVAPTGPAPDSIDIPLYPQKETDPFHVIFFGDPQPRNVEEVNYIAHKVVEELIGTEAIFGVTLGDIVFDDLSVFPVLNGVVGQIGVPWYNVIGNHDINKEPKDDALSDETFERIYGPNYYAFAYGKVHFLVLDNVLWDGERYTGEFGERQLQFIKNYLSFVPKDHLVVPMMHIPLNTVSDRAALLDLLKDRPNNFSLSAHWHRQGTFFINAESNTLGDHHHLVHGTVSGSWWSGLKDEWGIPHALMSDGTPNGYSIGTFKGTDYSLKYKVARRPPEFQMSIFTPEAVTQTDLAQTELIVNVFLGSAQSDVQWRIGDTAAWTPMTLTERQDPYYQQLKEREFFLPPVAARRLPDAANSTHVWVANLPAGLPVGTHTIHVRTEDMFGQTFDGYRIIRVE